MSSVPAHCFIVVRRHADITIYESVTRGVLRETVDKAECLRRINEGYVYLFKVTDSADLEAGMRYLNSEVGHGYGWTSILCRWLAISTNWLLHLLRVKAIAHFDSEDRLRPDCADLVDRFLRACGIDVRKALADSGNDFAGPVSPNDLMYACKLLAKGAQ